MDDEIPDTMNLDLNLGPLDTNLAELGLFPSEPMNLEDWMEGRVHQLRRAARRRSRLQQLRHMWRQDPVIAERNIALELMVNSSSDGGGSAMAMAMGVQQPGEGSVASEDRNPEAIKTCENHNTNVEDEVLGKKGDMEKFNGDGGSFFDCNICLELATDPVVTCCGHLFCWPCIYQWLHVHSHAKECPVCKGEVTIKGVTPIYGRGNNTHNSKDNSSPKIPMRPPGHRVESWRQTLQRNSSDFPIDEMIRRLHTRFDLTQDAVQVQPQTTDGGYSLPERSRSLLNRILNTRAIRREHNTVVAPPNEVVDLTQSIAATNSETDESRQSRRVSSLLLRRSHSHRVHDISHITSVLASAEMLVESYYRDHPVERNQEQAAPHIDDRDSVSSIAAVIHSESQTVDTAVEIDPMVSVSTASSRRRNEASRVSDIDSGDSRAPRRRRLN